MNLTDKISLSTGLRLKEPFIYERFFPPPSKKYILIENSSRDGCKEYKSSDELSSIIFPFLSQEKIDLYQFKINKTDKSIYRAKQLNSLDLQQINNVIKFSELVITNNPYTAHIANYYGIENIFLQEYNLYPLHNPTYKNSTKTIKGGINCFPELICKKILNHFNIESILSRINPIYQGPEYENKKIECVPDFDLNSFPIAKQKITIRADLHFDEYKILNLITNNKSTLQCSKLIDLKYLNNDQIFPNLNAIHYEVTNNTSEEEIDKLADLNKEVIFYTNDKDNLNKIRLKHIDHAIKFNENNKNLDILKSLCNNEVYYKSAKVIMARGKQYSSESNWKKDIPISKNFESIHPTECFAKELEQFKLFTLDEE